MWKAQKRMTCDTKKVLSRQSIHDDFLADVLRSLPKLLNRDRAVRILKTLASEAGVVSGRHHTGEAAGKPRRKCCGGWHKPVLQRSTTRKQFLKTHPTTKTNGCISETDLTSRVFCNGEHALCGKSPRLHDLSRRRKKKLEDRNASEEVQEAIPDDPEQLRETQPARGLPVPRQPSQHEREEHELTHLPFRAWCKTCVAAKARHSYHTKQPDRRDCLQLDFGFLTEGNRQDAVLVVTDARTGCCATLLCETKHTTETLIRFVLSFIYET